MVWMLVANLPPGCLHASLTCFATLFRVRLQRRVCSCRQSSSRPGMLRYQPCRCRWRYYLVAHGLVLHSQVVCGRPLHGMYYWSHWVSDRASDNHAFQLTCRRRKNYTRCWIRQRTFLACHWYPHHCRCQL